MTSEKVKNYEMVANELCIKNNFLEFVICFYSVFKEKWGFKINQKRYNTIFLIVMHDPSALWSTTAHLKQLLFSFLSLKICFISILDLFFQFHPPTLY